MGLTLRGVGPAVSRKEAGDAWRRGRDKVTNKRQTGTGLREGALAVGGVAMRGLTRHWAWLGEKGWGCGLGLGGALGARRCSPHGRWLVA